jgi:hypothetical protein
LVAVAVLLAGSRPAGAVTPASPEVRKLIDSALAYLERPFNDANGNKLGGKCLVGLAFLKANRRDHPRVAEAVQACREGMAGEFSQVTLDVYSHGLAVIFLCEAATKDTSYSREIQWYLNTMRQRQKDHGGWGYYDQETGDTSQTQYATLSYWEAQRRGIRIDSGSVERVAEWLIRTQGPDGCWGYQGIIGPPGQPVPQDGRQSCSMLSAGLGSTYICAKLLGLHAGLAVDYTEGHEAPPPLPAALRRVGEEETGLANTTIRPQRIQPAELLKTIERAHGWMDKNYKIDIGAYSFYYLYALERYRSFQEVFDGAWEEEPRWYNDGYEFLVKKQLNGSYWHGGCQPVCDTAFAVLFLLRSTQQSLRGTLGEGALVSGRGLPSNLANAKLVDGQLVIAQVQTKVDALLAMVDAGDDATLDDLARDPSQLVVEQVDANSARRLQQLARGGEPDVRLLAVRALGRIGNLDYAPTLIFALTDPDRRVVLEARNGLRFISRRFSGYGPPDSFTEEQRYEAIDAWKKWYRSLRPNAVFEL